jgi:glycosyltransferase involved in cell wall biosynthesis
MKKRSSVIKKKRVLFLLRNTFTNDSRVLKEGTSLVNAGYDVTLACDFRSGLSKQETINGIKVNRFDRGKRLIDFLDVPSMDGVSLKKRSLVSRFRKCIRPFLSSIRMMWGGMMIFCFYIKSTFKIHRSFSHHIDIVHCHDLGTFPMGVFFKIFTFGRIKIVYDAHEYETEVRCLTVGWKKILCQITEAFCIRFADKIITVSDSIANEYVRLYNIKKPVVVLNAPVFAQPKHLDIFRKELGIKKDQLIFIYQGGLSPGRGVELIIDTFKELGFSNKVVVFLGYGDLEGMVQEEARKYPNIYFYPAVEPCVLLDYTASADIGLVLTKNTCLNHYYCLPNKLFEYTMAKIPTIVSNLFELSKFIQDNGNGLILKEMTAKGLKELIENITSQEILSMKKAADQARKKYHWAEQEKKLIDLYHGF